MRHSESPSVTRSIPPHRCAVSACTSLLLALVAASPWLAQERAFTIEDVDRVHLVSEVQVSPDGEWFASVSTPGGGANPHPMPTAGGEARALTLSVQAGAPLPPPRDVDELIERAQRYVVEYGAEMSLVIGVERYIQRVAHGQAGTLSVTSGELPWSRETVSEFALVRVKDDWMGYRDVYEVDGKPVGDRHDRLQQLFLQQSPATAMEQGRKIADDSARYNAGAVQRNFNSPTMALSFLHPSNAGRFRFERAGTDTIDRTPAWKVRYREVKVPTIVRTSDGKSLPARGMFWIDPALGRVLKTSLEITSQAEFDGGTSAMPESLGASGAIGHDGAADRRVDIYSRVTTTYKHDPRLGLLLPAEMIEEYQGLSASRQTGRERITRINCTATYAEFKKFETAGRIVPEQ